MILTVIPDRETDLARIGTTAAAALCGAGITSALPDGLPARRCVAGLEVQCDRAHAPFAKAGFVAVGFQTIESVRLGRFPAKTNLVTLTVVRGPQQNLSLAGIAAKALCGAGVTQPFPDGSSYHGDADDPS